MKLLLTAASMVIAGFLLTGCGDSKDEAAKPAEAPAAEATKPAEAPAAEAAKPAEAPAAEAPKPADAAPAADAGAMLAGADFVAKAESLDGKPVTLALCSLDTTPINDQLACRVVDADGKDVKTKDNLPVDVFVKIAGLDAPSQDYVKTTCASNYCATKVSGTLKFSPGTGFIEIMDARLSAAK